MKCPNCNTEEGIKWFLRHSSKDENDQSKNADTITILCTKCGENESYYLEDCLCEIFTNWTESRFDFKTLTDIVNTTYSQENNFEK